MPRYNHKLRCLSCRDIYEFESRFEDMDCYTQHGREKIGWNSIFHAEIYRAQTESGITGVRINTVEKHCAGRLQFQSTTQIEERVHIALAPNDPVFGQRILQQVMMSASVPTVAVMWCDEAQKWYTGKCRHGLDHSFFVPRGLSARIKGLDSEKENEADSFGENCAEVECVIKAYKAGRRKQNLSGCVFIAMNQRGPIRACKTCNSWITTYRGKSL